MAKGIDGLDASSQKVTNVATPTVSSDAATMGYADTKANYRGAWSGVSNYALNDIVTNSNKLYVCTSPVTAGAFAQRGAVTKNHAAAGSPANVALSAGSAAGDLMVLSMSEITSTPVAPTGFTSLFTNTHTSLILGVFWKVLVAGDISSGFVTVPSQTTRWSATQVTFQGAAVDTTNSHINSTYVTTAATATGTGFAVLNFLDLVTAGFAVTYPAGTANNTSEVDTTTAFVLNAVATLAVTAGAVATQTFACTNDDASRVSAAVTMVMPSAAFQSANFVEIGAVHDASGRLQAADPSAATDLVSLQYLQAHVTDVQIFTTPGGTFTKPANAKVCTVLCIGAGGAGASGGRFASANVPCGGGGGGGGGLSTYQFPATVVPSSVTVTVPAGGVGGAAQTVDGTPGVTGTAASGNTTFGALLQANRGSPGVGGGAAGAGSGGGGGGGMLVGGAGGTAPATGLAGNGAVITNGSAPGGGAGGGVTATPTANAGGNGAIPTSLPGAGAALGGTVGAGQAGGTGSSSTIDYLGSAGGGGAGNASAAAGAGGAGGVYGAGGGGGGAAVNGNASGKGGDGGAGLCIVVTEF